MCKPIIPRVLAIRTTKRRAGNSYDDVVIMNRQSGPDRISSMPASGEPAASLGPPELAAEALFEDSSAQPDYEPTDESNARRAVEHFGRLFARIPGAIRAALEGATAGAEMLSGDRLQGVAEIIQNADDAGARSVQFQLVGDVLVAVHDGRPVRLGDILPLATPWLSNKVDDANATGRFGIGLMTLRSLSDVLEVHSGPYHLRLGNPTITTTDERPPEGVVAERDSTVLCIPLKQGQLGVTELDAWLGRWDDSALLFCRTVQRITIVGSDGDVIRTLSMAWSEEEPGTCVIGGEQLSVRRRRARSTDGRSWIVHSAETTAPTGVMRARKATGKTIPLALALPLQQEATGLIYAGLPVVETRVPVRVNAQFDPTTSRQNLANTPWNNAMLPLIADLWVETVRALFTERPALGWSVVPLESDYASHDQRRKTVSDRLESLLLERARTELVGRLHFVAAGLSCPLTSLAVEEAPLEGVLTASEIAQLASLDATLPNNARDSVGRWRRVLQDWRTANPDLPDLVTVARALDLLQFTERPPSATVALTAVGLAAGFGDRLAGLPCVVVANGDHLKPPTRESLETLVVEQSPLAEVLGIGLRLHSAYLIDDDRTTSVLRWLRERGAITDGANSESVIRHLAAAGRAGHRLSEPLKDEQLTALRDAFEQMTVEDRAPLGPSVGSTILLNGYSFDSLGNRAAMIVRPVDAYLPSAIDKEPDSFARAAGQTPGLIWLRSQYIESLKSSLGRTGGLGAQKFLRLLGAETAPRLLSHGGTLSRFAGAPRGLAVGAIGSPQQRDQALRSMGARYTLNDIDSPDLRAVVENIAKEKGVTRRRERAGALLGALGRAWERLSEQAEVTAASDYYSWQPKGPVPAFWLWSVGATAWLDDTDDNAQPPLELRLRRPATVAVHGPNARGYLRPEFDIPNRREVLTALGVTGEPSTRDLLERLRKYRDAPEDSNNAEAEVAVVYEALAERMTRGQSLLPGDLNRRDLRAAFADGDGLVRTQLGWRVPMHVLDGPPVFGHLRAFVPQVRNTTRLWTALQIRQPSLEDCLRVISELARKRVDPSGSDEVILLETLRLLAGHLGGDGKLPVPNKQMGKVALWTSLGWRTERPVYAVDDPTLTAGLGAKIPLWLPGGELSQFQNLLAPLRIQHLETESTAVVDPDRPVLDPEATAIFRAAVPLLQVDLARNDPLTASALHTSWSRIGELEVRVDSDLSVRVNGLVGDHTMEVPVTAKADVDGGVLYLSHSALLRQVEGGGRAIAGLFSGDGRRLSQAWLAACVAAEDGRTAERMVLSGQRAQEELAQNDREMAERLAAFRDETAAGHVSRSRRQPIAPVGGIRTSTVSLRTPAPKRPRILVDPATLEVSDPFGHPGSPTPNGRTAGRRTDGGRGPRLLTPPDRSGTPPRASTPAAAFTQLDAESVGLELVRMVLAGDRQEIVDLRAQRCVGADAIDELGRFYELKVYLHDEPDTIRLEESQIRRAMSTPDFFLVVVSGIEGTDAHPKVRVIIDPLNQLRMTATSAVSFTGVRSAEHSLVYDLAPAPDYA